MEWRDEGVILSVRRHGETSAIAEILTAGHGRVPGLVRDGTIGVDVALIATSPPDADGFVSVGPSLAAGGTIVVKPSEF
jgi:acyl-CoA reductase-like NAD-dependent aldehyde dehydrogenase